MTTPLLSASVPSPPPRLEVPPALRLEWWSQADDHLSNPSPELLPPSLSLLPFNVYYSLIFPYRVGIRQYDSLNTTEILKQGLFDQYRDIADEAAFQIQYSQLVTAHTVDASTIAGIYSKNVPPEYKLATLYIAETNIRDVIGWRRWDQMTEVIQMRKDQDLKKATQQYNKEGRNEQEVGVESGEATSKAEIDERMEAARDSNLLEDVKSDPDLVMASPDPSHRIASASNTEKRGRPDDAQPTGEDRSSKQPRSATTSASQKQGPTKPDILFWLKLKHLMIVLIIELKWTRLLQPHNDPTCAVKTDPLMSVSGGWTAVSADEQIEWAMRDGGYQTIWYLHAGGKLASARLAVAQVNEYFARMTRMEDGTIAIELGRDMKAADIGKHIKARRAQSNSSDENTTHWDRVVTIEELNELKLFWRRLPHSLVTEESRYPHEPPGAQRVEQDTRNWKVDQEALERLTVFIYTALYLAGTAKPNAPAGIVNTPPRSTRSKLVSALRMPLDSADAENVGEFMALSQSNMGQAVTYNDEAKSKRSNRQKKDKKKRNLAQPSNPPLKEGDSEDESRDPGEGSGHQGPGGGNGGPGKSGAKKDGRQGGGNEGETGRRAPGGASEEQEQGDEALAGREASDFGINRMLHGETVYGSRKVPDDSGRAVYQTNTNHRLSSWLYESSKADDPNDLRDETPAPLTSTLYRDPSATSDFEALETAGDKDWRHYRQLIASHGVHLFVATADEMDKIVYHTANPHREIPSYLLRPTDLSAKTSQATELRTPEEVKSRNAQKQQETMNWGSATRL
ncbi:hypothetical protein BCR39DRAFT_562161 [Naematelia encephala]|uniref:Uncharacterized protein n=1 Tax=Naematelia encephala TaxID=71784 RepID=A0A1Y2AJZ3_9TREE|nr:hypothetical protein BCR39DRAFT_562161 [Naematelia encephala]